MRNKEIRELSDEEIGARISELEEERFNLRFRSATQPLEDPLRFRVIRKDVARLKTVLRERELEGKDRTSTPRGGTGETPRARAKAKTKSATAAR